MIDYLPALVAAWSIQLASALTPGPVVMLILGYAATGQRRRAALAAVGTATAAMILAAATVLGLSALIAQMSWGMTALRIAGCAYLLWLAWTAFRRSFRDADINLPVIGSGSAFRSALLLGMTSPKAVAFWLAIAAVIPAAGSSLPVTLTFAVGSFILSLTVHGCWALLLSSPPVQAGYARARRWVDRALGTFFAVFAVRLATERS